MEIHRLKPMGEYDEQLFNELYEKTFLLRKKLAREIDPRLFKVSQDVIESWFDDKFIYVFNKYHHEKESLLLGYIINALSNFKKRILRKGYSPSIENNTIDIGELNSVENYLQEDPEKDESKELFLNLALEFMKKELSTDAYEILELELNPPQFIQQRLRTPNSKIPIRLFIEFLNLPDSYYWKNYLASLRDEIEETTKKARQILNTCPASA